MAISELDRQLLLKCAEVRGNSFDPDRAVGVVIADKEGHVVSVGANAPPTSLRMTRDATHDAIRKDPTWKYFMLEHAERNAIFAACADRKAIAGGTMYSTLFPCADCARAIVAAGLSRLVVFRVARDPLRDAKWLDHYRFAERIFEMAGVLVEFADVESREHGP